MLFPLVSQIRGQFQAKELDEVQDWDKKKLPLIIGILNSGELWGILKIV